MPPKTAEVVTEQCFSILIFQFARLYKKCYQFKGIQETYEIRVLGFD